MRLKGGKLLIDLMNNTKSLTQEELESILSKGLSVKIPFISSYIPIVIDVNFDTLVLHGDDNVVGLRKTLYANGDEYAVITLDLDAKTLSYAEL